jgi:Leucine-rich repeat (LRR) protein
MKSIIILFLLSLFSLTLSGQNANPDAAQIRQRIAQVRRSTNWNDPAAAKAANEKIKELSKQLVTTGSQSSAQNNTNTGEYAEEESELENAKAEIAATIIANALEGNEESYLMADPVRKQIIEEIKEEEAPMVQSQGYQNNITFLIINMSDPDVKNTISHMRDFKSVTTLVITGGSNHASVNLTDLLLRASNYPLETLYIINFRNNLTSIPPQINNFKNLSTLALFNNNISKLPVMTTAGPSIDTLFVDMNPITTLCASLESLPNLKKLGIAKTAINEAEISAIKQKYPHCQILTK